MIQFYAPEPLSTCLEGFAIVCAHCRTYSPKKFQCFMRFERFLTQKSFCEGGGPENKNKITPLPKGLYTHAHDLETPSFTLVDTSPSLSRFVSPHSFPKLTFTKMFNLKKKKHTMFRCNMNENGPRNQKL